MSSAGRLSSGGGSGGGRGGAVRAGGSCEARDAYDAYACCPNVRRSSSLPVSPPEGAAIAAADSFGVGQCLLVDQGEKLLSRPRPPGCRRGASGRGASNATSPMKVTQDDYADDEDYF